MNLASITVITLTVLIIGAFSFFFCWPLVRDGIKIYKETKKAETDLADLSTKKELLTKLSQNNQLTELKTIASKYIPQEVDSSGLILELTAIANQNQLLVEQTSLNTQVATVKKQEDSDTSQSNNNNQSNTKQTDQAAAQTVNFNLKVNGTYADFIKFLAGTETSSRLISLDSLGLSQTDKSFTASISGKAYWKVVSTQESTLANIKISDDVISKFKNLKTFSAPLTLTKDEGFGRNNPFERLNGESANPSDSNQTTN